MAGGNYMSQVRVISLLLAITNDTGLRLQSWIVFKSGCLTLMGSVWLKRTECQRDNTIYVIYYYILHTCVSDVHDWSGGTLSYGNLHLANWVISLIEQLNPECIWVAISDTVVVSRVPWKRVHLIEELKGNWYIKQMEDFLYWGNKNILDILVLQFL